MADEATSTTPPENTPEATAQTTPEATPVTEAPKEKAAKTYDETYVKDLRQESAGYRTRLREVESERDQFKERIAALEGETSGATSKLTELEMQKARLEVALDKGLPKELVPRLVGNTPEELAADAEQLLAFVNPAGSTAPRPNFDGGNRQNLKAPDLATQITEAEKAGDVKLSMALKARMAMDNRAKLGVDGAMSPLPPRS